MQTVPSGGEVPHFLLVGDNGVEVRLAFGRDWFMEYRSADLQARFLVGRDPPVALEKTTAVNERTLGPNCVVQMQRDRLSRPLEPKDYEILATNVKEVLRLHLQFPSAVPPKIEHVRFRNAELRPFDD
ncbi:MAG TPA: hypothetical protein VFB68_12870 [Xanthobacteraceae bacterium]|nr:hypothetical protein [Xanthobacteraceae bacterium]